MFAGFPNLQYVGCTANLSNDLSRVLGLLGYPVKEVLFKQSHCASSCEKTGAWAPQATIDHHGVERSSDWYDEETERTVRTWFWQDFRLFGFSLLAKDMFSSTCKPYIDVYERPWKENAKQRK
jgi:hypothetical protein